MAELPPLEWRGFEAPAYTQVPDALFDVLLPYLSDPELRVLLYIIRRTFGFKKTRDDISLSQITDGIVKLDGGRLDYGAGVSRPTAIKATRSLAAKGIISAQHNSSKERGNQTTTYTLIMGGAPLVNGVNQGVVKPVNQGSKGAQPPLVNGVDSQETVVQINSKQEDLPVTVDPAKMTPDERDEYVRRFGRDAWVQPKPRRQTR